MSDCIHPENTVLVAYRKGCRCDRCRSGYAEAHRVYSRRYVERHAGRRKASVRAWQDANQERHRRNRRATEAARRARKRDTHLSPEDAALVTMIYRLCPDGYEVDHICPLARGGKHCPGNLQYLKSEENARKGARIEYRPRRGTVIDWRDVVGKFKKVEVLYGLS